MATTPIPQRAPILPPASAALPYAEPEYEDPVANILAMVSTEHTISADLEAMLRAMPSSMLAELVSSYAEAPSLEAAITVRGQDVTTEDGYSFTMPNHYRSKTPQWDLAVRLILRVSAAKLADALPGTCCWVCISYCTICGVAGCTLGLQAHIRVRTS